MAVRLFHDPSACLTYMFAPLVPPVTCAPETVAPLGAEQGIRDPSASIYRYASDHFCQLATLTVIFQKMVPSLTHS